MKSWDNTFHLVLADGTDVWSDTSVDLTSVPGFVVVREAQHHLEREVELSGHEYTTVWEYPAMYVPITNIKFMSKGRPISTTTCQTEGATTEELSRFRELGKRL